MHKSNFHTHSTYCDGKHTLTELAEKAVELGMDSLGFSGHCYTDFDESYCMSVENTRLYRNEIAELKKIYDGKLKILCGIEQDYFAQKPTADYDYVIGSVHYVKKDGVYLPVDEDKDLLKSHIAQYFGGDALLYAQAYFALVGEVAQVTGAQIVGHFDLLTKFNEQEMIFDEANPLYRKAAEEALKKIAEQNVLMEINTGAMARGYRNKPYPNEWLFDLIAKYQIKVIINSDCHDKEALLYGFREAYDLAKQYHLQVVQSV